MSSIYSFCKIRSEFDTELNSYYSTYPTRVDHIEREINHLTAADSDTSPFRAKAALYNAVSRCADVHIFRYLPFYFEVNTGRARHSWGIGGIGAYLMESAFGRDYKERAKELQEEYADFFSFNSPFAGAFDHDHHCVGYDNVLEKGLNGILEEIEARVRQNKAPEEQDFLLSAAAGIRAMIEIAGRFAELAGKLKEDEQDPLVRANLRRIYNAALRCPMHPPTTFFEALNTLIFMREICGSLEGMGISTFGQVDRMLYPYYREDKRTGRIDRTEAQYLIDSFLAYTEVKFECRIGSRETSTTVVIGGCDEEGYPVFNELTKLIISSYRELRLSNPKLHCRISPDHPVEYFEQVSALVADGLNVAAIYNDPVVIGANVKNGREKRDARLYVAGGCQENMLANTEINSRATVYCNLSNVLLATLFPDRFESPRDVTLITDSSNFDTLYAAFIANLNRLAGKLVERRNRLEADGVRFNPCPLLSSTIDDCIVRRRDMTDGGTRYSSGSVGLTGSATLINSLFVIKKRVFEEGAIGLRELRDALTSDWNGLEFLRMRLVSSLPLYGSGDSDVCDFSAKVFKDIARATSGMPNARGGRYEASLFSHLTYRRFGEKTGATPDGRRNGDDLSKGVGPSFLTLGDECPATRIVDCLKPIDFKDFAVIGVLDLKLPSFRGNGSNGGRIVKAVIQRFLECEGSVLQINCVDQAQLVDARSHPERHADLVVRVSGYSARFVHLDPELQEEIINRTAATT